MFPFRKPPTRLELAKKGVSDAAHHLIEAIPTAQIEEKFDDLKKGAALATAAAAAAAHHAGEAAAHKLGELQSAASHLGEGVSGAAHSAQTASQSAAALAAAKASAATQAARESAQNARETLGDRAKTLSNFKERAAHDFAIGGKEAQNAKSVAQKAAEREAEAIKARAAALEAKKQAKLLEKDAEKAEKDADVSASEAKKAAAKALAEAQALAQQEKERAQAEAKAIAESEAKERVEREEAEAKAQAEAETFDAKVAKKQAKLAAKAEHKAHDLAEAAEQEREKAERKLAARREDDDEIAEVQIADGGSKLGWIILGLALGAVLALFLAPTSGRRSRAAIKDRLGKVGDGAVDAVTATSDKIVDIAQRVEGLSHKVETKLAADGETDDDTTVADRVRSILGHHELAKGLERLNIDCVEGVVTLRGPMLDETAQETLVTAVKTVPGVKDVVAEFLTDEAPENPRDSVI